MQVRKTTSASTASPMVLSAIERMESHHASPKSPLFVVGGDHGRAVPVSSGTTTTTTPTVIATTSGGTVLCPSHLLFSDPDPDTRDTASSPFITRAPETAEANVIGCDMSLTISDETKDRRRGRTSPGERSLLDAPVISFGSVDSDVARSEVATSPPVSNKTAEVVGNAAAVEEICGSLSAGTLKGSPDSSPRGAAPEGFSVAPSQESDGGPISKEVETKGTVKEETSGVVLEVKLKVAEKRGNDGSTFLQGKGSPGESFQERAGDPPRAVVVVSNDLTACGGFESLNTEDHRTAVTDFFFSAGATEGANISSPSTSLHIEEPLGGTIKSTPTTAPANDNGEVSTECSQDEQRSRSSPLADACEVQVELRNLLLATRVKRQGSSRLNPRAQPFTYHPTARASLSPSLSFRANHSEKKTRKLRGQGKKCAKGTSAAGSCMTETSPNGSPSVIRRCEMEKYKADLSAGNIRIGNDNSFAPASQRTFPTPQIEHGVLLQPPLRSIPTEKSPCHKSAEGVAESKGPMPHTLEIESTRDSGGVSGEGEKIGATELQKRRPDISTPTTPVLLPVRNAYKQCFLFI